MARFALRNHGVARSVVVLLGVMILFILIAGGAIMMFYGGYPWG